MKDKAFVPLTRRDLFRKGLMTGVSLPLVSAVGTVLVSSPSFGDSASGPKAGGTLRLAYTSGTVRESLDPALASMGNDSTYCANIYDRLVRIENDFSVRAELAEKWSSNADGSVWTFELRPNLKFSDGSPLTTADVQYSFARVLDEKTGSPGFGPLSQTLALDGIQVTDDRKIVFNLKGTNSQFPRTIATRNFAVVKKGTAEFTVETAIGSGPFILKSFAPGESWEMARNPNYWREGRPYLDGIRQVNIAEPATLVQSLLSGDSDLVGQVGPTQAKQVENDSNTALMASQNSGFMYVVMDLTQAPFTDPKVVMAVKLAVDRRVLVDTAFQGYGTLTSDVHLWPEHPAYPANLGVRKQDIAQAKQLLAEAGHPDGLELELFTSPSLGGMVELATAFAEIVKPAGIKVSIKQEDPGTYWNKVWQSKPMYVSYSAARPSVATLSNLYSTTPAWAETKIKNKKIDDLLAQVRGTLDEKQQDKLLQEAWLIVANEAGASIPCALTVLWGARKSVHDVATHMEDNLRFADAYLA